MEHLLVFIIMLVLPAYAVLTRERRKQILQQGGVRARIQAYWSTMIVLTVLVAACLLLPPSPGASWQTIGLIMPRTGAVLVSLFMALLAGAFLLFQVRAVATDVNAVEKIAPAFQPIAYLLPHSAREYRVWIPLSITAGVCEEIIFRGYLTAYLSQVMAVPLAGVVAVVPFAVSHAYQGPRGVMKVFVLGLILFVLYYFSGSLLAPILLHIFVDLHGGALAKLVLQRSENQESFDD